MPIEIKELHIRVAVDTREAEGSRGISTATAGNLGGSSANSDKDAIVADCVEQVLQVLQNRGER